MAPKRRDRDGGSGDSSAGAGAKQPTTNGAAAAASAGGGSATAAGTSGAGAAASQAATGGSSGLNATSGALVVSSAQQQQMQTDTQMFLLAFEKPTQIYRYLRTRNMISPVFLHRNLTYMKDRMQRTNRSRTNYQVNSLLAVKQQQQQQRVRTENGGSGGFWLGEHLTLIFLGYNDKQLVDEEVCVEVETYMSHISHKKRKDSSKMLQERIGHSVVRVNPEGGMGKVPTVSVATETFNSHGSGSGAGNDPLRKSFILQLQVTVTPVANTAGHQQQPTGNATADGCSSPAVNGFDCGADADDREPPMPAAKRARTQRHASYESELVVFDKLSRCMLTDGEYELAMRERPVSAPRCAYSPKKHPTWESLPDGGAGLARLEKAAFDDFGGKPILKFRLSWTRERYPEWVDRPLPITVIKRQQQQQMQQLQQVGVNGVNNNSPSSCNNNGGAEGAEAGAGAAAGAGAVAVPVAAGVDYYFIYNNNTRQQTEACEDYHCPWCSLNCIALYSLLKHLKLCHARFNFTYVPMGGGGGGGANAGAVSPRARIDVCINELFDGSYTGSPNDLVGPSGFAFSRAGPVQRTIVTRILVCRPRRSKPTLSEFLEVDENELNSQRPYITGHNRLYHHTMTCLPVHPKELDIDSEGENDPAWLQHKTMMMIDEFTDVNEGEKELMKMWNLHIMKNGYVGDIQIPLACDMFIDIRGRDLLSKNLYKNFVMHLCNLFDYGLISAETHFKIVQKLQRMLANHEAARIALADSRRAQMSHWQLVGYARHQQKLREEAEDANAGDQKCAALAQIKQSGSGTSRTTALLQSPSTSSSTSANNNATTTSLPPRLSTTGAANHQNNHSNSKQHNNTANTTKLPDECHVKAEPSQSSNSSTSSSSQQSASSSSSSSAASSSSQPLPLLSGSKRKRSSKDSDSGVTGSNTKPNTAAAAAKSNGRRSSTTAAAAAEAAQEAAAAAAAAPISNKRRFSHLRGQPSASIIKQPKKQRLLRSPRMSHLRSRLGGANHSMRCNCCRPPTITVQQQQANDRRMRRLRLLRRTAHKRLSKPAQLLKAVDENNNSPTRTAAHSSQSGGRTVRQLQPTSSTTVHTMRRLTIRLKRLELCNDVNGAVMGRRTPADNLEADQQLLVLLMGRRRLSVRLTRIDCAV